ncbi:MAG: penicillin acylase family protein [Bdellovibrionales bacterium]|nr:penicillin acylase family protein [Bdellovibrionales bacterium]
MRLKFLPMAFPLLLILLAWDSFEAPAAETPRTWNCRVLREPGEIPRIEGADRASLAACWGWVHGRERAFQMDYLRRVSQGRRAEILGPSELRGDMMMRLLGLAERAQALSRELPPELKEGLEAYSAGVTQGFRDALLAADPELERFGVEPEAWKPEDSIALLLLQSFDQTRKTFTQDLAEAAWGESLGEEAPGLTTSDGLPWDDAILDPGEHPASETGGKSAAAAPRKRERGASLGSRFPGLSAWAATLFPPLGAGSNNWVVAPSRSATGRAWLANDPHLDLKRPSFWHWAHVSVAGKFQAFGAGVPGVPVVASGTNGRVAWGLTNAYLDVADAVSVPENDPNLRRQTTRLRPWVWVRVLGLRLPFFFKSFERVGPQKLPVLPLEGAGAGRKLVLRWTGFDLAPHDLAGLWNVVEARDARTLDDVLSQARIPSWNFVFADVSGNIGYRAVGRVPVRRESAPYGVETLSVEELLAPRETLSPSQMPHVLNPRRGWIATANQRQWRAGSSLHPGRGHSAGFRGHRIRGLLSSSRKHSLESMKATICDTRAVDAPFFVPLLIEALPAADAKAHADALTILRDWDFSTGPDCRACGIYRRWMDQLLDKSGWPEPAVYRMLQSEPRSLPVAAALEHALADLKGAEPFPTWDRLHRAAFPHIAGESYFRAAPIFAPGDKHSVNPGTANWVPGRGYAVSSGASQRVVIELTNPPRVHALLAGSNSGPARASIDSEKGPWRRWAECKFDRIPFPAAVSDEAWTELSFRE